MPLNLDERLMITPSELARLYPFHYKSWMRWLRAGRVPGAGKVAGRWLVPIKVAEQLMAGKTPLDQMLSTQMERLNAAGGKR